MSKRNTLIALLFPLLVIFWISFGKTIPYNFTILFVPFVIFITGLPQLLSWFIFSMIFGISEPAGIWFNTLTVILSFPYGMLVTNFIFKNK